MCRQECASQLQPVSLSEQHAPLSNVRRASWNICSSCNSAQLRRARRNKACSFLPLKTPTLNHFRSVGSLNHWHLPGYAKYRIGTRAGARTAVSLPPYISLQVDDSGGVGFAQTECTALWTKPCCTARCGAGCSLRQLQHCRLGHRRTPTNCCNANLPGESTLKETVCLNAAEQHL